MYITYRRIFRYCSWSLLSLRPALCCTFSNFQANPLPCTQLYTIQKMIFLTATCPRIK